MRVRIGIDIGKDGGIAVFQDGKCTHLCKTPDIGGEIDVFALSMHLNKWRLSDVHACIEDVHSVYGSSAASNFQFGRSAGIIEGILHAAKIPFTKITPKTWQKEMWQGVDVLTKTVKIKGKIKIKNDTKAMSLIAIKRLYPDLNLLPSKRAYVPHDGMVDAALIGAYCNRKF